MRVVVEQDGDDEPGDLVSWQPGFGTFRGPSVFVRCDRDGRERRFALAHVSVRLERDDSVQSTSTGGPRVKVYGGMTNAGSRFVKPETRPWKCPKHGPQPKHRLNCPERGCTARQRP